MLLVFVLACQPRADDVEGVAACDAVLYADADADGHGDASSAACEGVTVADDCDDADPQRHPGLPERCDEVDNDCDGLTDEDLPLLTGYADADGDGYGDPALPVEECALPDGFVATPDDCDDTRAEVHPGPTDTCNDGVDQNCDGTDSEACRQDGQALISDAAMGYRTPQARSSLGVLLATIDGVTPPAIVALEATVPTPYSQDYAAVSFPAVAAHSGQEPMTRWLAAPDANVASMLAAVGDLDRDGTTDLAMDASGLKLYHFEESGTFTGDDWFARFEHTMGRTVTAPGDLDADGYADLAVSHYYEPSPTVDHAGVVRLFAGPFAGDYVADDAIARWWGVDDEARFGWTLKSADADGDGQSDVIVGSPFETVASPGGSVWILTDASLTDVPASDAAWAHLSSDSPGEDLGWKLDAGTDVDGDGHPDILAGGRAHTLNEELPWSLTSHRVATLFAGGRGGELGPAEAALARFTVTETWHGEHVEVACAGDLDGDGFGDVAISAPYHSGPDGHLGGSVFVFYGPVEGEQVLEEADLWLYHDQPYAELGYALEGGADLDEDGFDDLVIGAPNGLGTGQVWLFFGG